MSECIEVKLVDSFVKNKIGDGNGESTIYLGGKLKHQLILDVFGDFNKSKLITFTKSNLIKSIGFFQSFYENPHEFYLNTGETMSFKQDLSAIYKQALTWFKSCSAKIQEDAYLISPDTQGRVYLRFDPESFLRKFILPHSTICEFIKSKDGELICTLIPDIMSTKKTIKIDGKKYWIEFNYFS